VGSVFGAPLAELLHEKTGSWTPVFEVLIALDLITALLAFFVLRPMRRRYLAAKR
jgi:cyanate permease